MRMVISIGSNLADPQAQAEGAIERLADEFTLLARSSLYRTSPVGRTDQPEFCNAVAIIDSDLHPNEVLQRLHAIEASAGRVRDERWGPRVLDLDLIAVGDLVIDDPRCRLPHPRAHERAFVLVPWAEIDADAVLPGRGPILDLIPYAEGSVTR